jgi:hydrogenase maturation protein HypF
VELNGKAVHPSPLVFYAAVMKDAAQPQLAGRFLVWLQGAEARPILACGAELKNTFWLAQGHHAFVSHHIGNLENYETLRAFTEGIEHYRQLFVIDPSVVAYDLHPEYLSTKYVLDLDGVELVGVPHIIMRT